MSRQDPSAATGQQPYEPAYCTCGHQETFHKPSGPPAGLPRGACSASTCTCKRFTPKETDHA